MIRHSSKRAKLTWDWGKEDRYINRLSKQKAKEIQKSLNPYKIDMGLFENKPKKNDKNYGKPVKYKKETFKIFENKPRKNDKDYGKPIKYNKKSLKIFK